MMYRQFYKELNKVLFAVTDVDGVMTRPEKNSVLHSVALLFFNDKKTNSDQDAGAPNTTPASALHSFLDFIEDNYHLFDEKIRKAGNIAASVLWQVYNETNKKEKRLVEQILNKFKEE
jgi:hypothetical protein